MSTRWTYNTTQNINLSEKGNIAEQYNYMQVML